MSVQKITHGGINSALCSAHFTESRSWSNSLNLLSQAIFETDITKAGSVSAYVCVCLCCSTPYESQIYFMKLILISFFVGVFCFVLFFIARYFLKNFPGNPGVYSNKY